MKKILSFTLAVVLALSLLVGSAFASSGVTVVAPDTFVSWGSVGDLTSLAVPSAAVSDGNKYIIYQVRDWVVSYFRVRFVIDSFSRGDPVEGETLSWTRYIGSWGIGVNAALEPSSYEVEYHAAEEYTYSKNFLHLPVKSNFNYYDANGELIISGTGYDNDFEGLMDLTLTDGTVIQVPRRLVGNQFVVVRNSFNADVYKIWNFGTPDTLGDIYEGADGVNYLTSVGSFVSGFDISPFPLPPSWDVATYPYFVVAGNPSNMIATARVFKAVDLPYLDFSYVSGATLHCSNTSAGKIYGRYNDFNGSSWTQSDGWKSISWSAGGQVLASAAVVLYSNFDLYDAGGNLVFAANVSLDGSGSFEWSDWESSTATLALTSYGDIVYQTFDYPLSNPDDDPAVSPDPDTGIPDASNNGLFPWLRTQWVFLLQKLQDIVDAIKGLTFDLDPVPDQTKPILDDFFEHIFSDRVSSDDVSGIGNVLDKMGDWFDTGHGLSDLFGVFEDEGFDSWFSNETQEALDSVGSDE